MSVGDDSTEASVSSNRAVVVRALRSNVAIFRPAQRPGQVPSLSADQGVLLLDAEPWLFVRASVEDFLCMRSEVSVCWHESLESVV